MPAVSGRTSRRRGRKLARERLRSTSCGRSTITHIFEAFADGVRAALDQIPGAQVIYTAHSVPLTMSESSEYVQQLQEACRLVSETVGVSNWRLVYQSRSGAPGQPSLNRTLAMCSVRWNRDRTSCWRRSGLYRITWKCSTISTPKRARFPKSGKYGWSELQRWAFIPSSSR